MSKCLLHMETQNDIFDFIKNKIEPNETITFIQSNEDENIWMNHENNFVITSNQYDNNNNLKISKISFSNDYEIRLNKSLDDDIILFNTEDSLLKIQVPQHDELWSDNHRYTEIWLSFSVYEDTVLSD